MSRLSSYETEQASGSQLLPNTTARPHPLSLSPRSCLVPPSPWPQSIPASRNTTKKNYCARNGALRNKPKVKAEAEPVTGLGSGPADLSPSSPAGHRFTRTRPRPPTIYTNTHHTSSPPPAAAVLSLRSTVQRAGGSPSARPAAIRRHHRRCPRPLPPTARHSQKRS